MNVTLWFYAEIIIHSYANTYRITFNRLFNRINVRKDSNNDKWRTFSILSSMYLSVWPRYQQNPSIYILCAHHYYMYAVTEITSVKDKGKEWTKIAKNKKIDWISIHFHSHCTSKPNYITHHCKLPVKYMPHYWRRRRRKKIYERSLHSRIRLREYKYI